MTPRKTLTPEERNLCHHGLDNKKSKSETTKIQAQKLINKQKESEGNAPKHFITGLFEAAKVFHDDIKRNQIVRKAKHIKAKDNTGDTRWPKPEFPHMEELLLSIVTFPLNKSKIIEQANKLLHEKFSHLIDEKGPKRVLSGGWYKCFLVRHDLKNKNTSEMERLQNRPKILCLAMSYTDVGGTIGDRLTPKSSKDGSFRKRKVNNNKTNSNFWKKVRTGSNNNKYLADTNLFDLLHPSIDEVRALTYRLIPENDARDLAKIIATEEICDCNVYTNSMQEGTEYRTDRHVYSNWTKSKYLYQLKKQFGNDIKFSQIVFDTCWCPQGYHHKYWPQNFFNNLPKLVQILEDPVEDKLDEEHFETGVILFPFTLHKLYYLVHNIEKMKKVYEISFGTKDELGGNALWKGTQAIPADIMVEEYKKIKNQEDYYSTFNQKDVSKKTPPGHDEKEVERIVMSIPEEKFKNLRFIRLTKLTGRPGEVPGFNLTKRSNRFTAVEQIDECGQLTSVRGFRMKCTCSFCTGRGNKNLLSLLAGAKRSNSTNDIDSDAPGSKVQCLEGVDNNGQIRRIV